MISSVASKRKMDADVRNVMKYVFSFSIYQFLESFQEVAENNNFFDPGFSPQQMDHIPELYKSIIDDPAAIHDIFKKVGSTWH